MPNQAPQPQYQNVNTDKPASSNMVWVLKHVVISGVILTISALISWGLSLVFIERDGTGSLALGLIFLYYLVPLITSIAFVVLRYTFGRHFLKRFEAVSINQVFLELLLWGVVAIIGVKIIFNPSILPADYLIINGVRISL